MIGGSVPIPASRPPLSQPTKQESFVIFLITDLRYFTFLYQHIKYTTEGLEEKKSKQSDLGWHQAQESGSLWHFWAALRAFAGYHGCICTRNFHKATRSADSPSRVSQPGICWSTGPSSRLSDFCWLVSSLPDSHLLNYLFCLLVSAALFCWLFLWDFPSLVLFRSRGRYRKQALCVGFVPKQRDSLTGTHTHRNECHPSCHRSFP